MPKTNLRDILKTLSKWSSTAIKSSILYFFHKDKLQHHLINAKNHIKKHHKKYLWGTVLSGGGFFAVKALIVLAGVFGILGHSGTFASGGPLCGGRDNSQFLTGSFRNSSPSNDNIICALLGDGNGGSNRTAYTQNRPNVACNISSMTVTGVSPGTDTLPLTLADNTIYVLESGTYITTATRNMGNCTAILGKGTVEIKANYATNTRLLVSSAKTDEILDNLKLNRNRGTNTGTTADVLMIQTTTGATINSIETYSGYLGIFDDGSSYMTVNNSKSYGNASIGIDFQNGSHYAILSGSQIYGNVGYGIYVASSSTGQINNSKSYNNTGIGLYLNVATGTQINNSQINNNGDMGINVYKSNYTVINNSQSYSNSGDGIKFATVTSGQVNNSQSYSNLGVGINGNSSDNIQVNNSQSHHNLSYGIYEVGGSNLIVNSGVVYNNTGMGIYFNTVVSGGQVNNSQVYSNGDVGIEIYKSNNIQVNSSSVYSGKTNGIDFDTNSNYGIVNNCQVYGNTGYGIYFYSSSTNGLISGSQVYGNISYGIYFYISADSGVIYNTQVHHNITHAVVVSNASNVVVNSGAIYNNTGMGIYFNGGGTGGQILNSIVDWNANVGIDFNASISGLVSNTQSYNNSSYGIYFSSSSDSGTVTGCQVHNNTSAGIGFSVSQYGQVFNSQSYNNTQGIYFYNGSNYGAVNNSQSYNNTGIGIYFSNAISGQINNTLSYNNTSYGIAYSSSDNGTINYSQSYSNASYGIYFSASTGGQVNNSQSSGNINYGIAYSSSINGVINNSQSYNNTSYGIYFSSSSHSGTIINSQSYRNNNDGIEIINSSGIIINSGSVYNNTGIGIYFSASTGGQVNNSQSYSNTSYGIFYSYSTGGQINNSQSYSNRNAGIYYSYSVNGTISNSQSYNNNSHGILFSYSANGVISGSSFYTNTGVGVYFANSNNEQLNNSQSYGNTSYGVYYYPAANSGQINSCQIYNNKDVGISYSSSNGGQVNNSQIYGNTNYGIFTSASSYITVNNSQIYNTKATSLGIYFYSSSLYATVNNSQVYNNYYGIGFGNASNFGSINNTQIYNNTSNGLYYVDGYSGSINNVSAYNNGGYGISCVGASNNGKYYGTINIFGNANGIGCTTTNLSTGTDGLVGRSNGTINTTPTMTRDYITNPRNILGNDLFPRTGTMASLRGINTTFSFTSGMLYSFGSGTLLQKQPVLYSGTTLISSGTFTGTMYIGGSMTKVTGDLLGINAYNTLACTVTGSSAGAVTNYNVYGNIVNTISGAAINTATGIQIATGTTATIITQLYTPGNFLAMHFQKVTTIDTTSPSIPTLVSPTNSGSFVVSTGMLVWSVSTDTGAGTSGYLYQVSTDSGFSAIVYSGNTSATGINLTGFTSKTYYRRIASYDGAGNSSSRSSARSFTIQLCGNRNNDQFLTGSFRDSNPSNDKVLCALFGDGSGGTDTTAYTQNRPNVTCNIASMTVTGIAPGTDVLPTTLADNTVYVLGSGLYITTARRNMGNCTAIVGTGTVEIRDTDATNNSLLQSTSKNDILLDNINLNRYRGTNTGGNIDCVQIGGTIGAAINSIDSYSGYNGLYTYNNSQYINITNSKFHEGTSRGIVISFTQNSIISDSLVYKNSLYGIDVESSTGIQINNTSVSSGSNYGFYVNNSNNITINSGKSYGNASCGIYFNSSNSGTTNNSQSYNNSGYGISFNLSNYGAINNSQSYNNGNNGIYFSTSNYGTINNSQSYNNSGSAAIYFLSSTGGQISGSKSYSNTGYGIEFNLSSSGTINNSQSSGNTNNGIYVGSSTGIQINGCQSYNNTTYGISIASATGIQISGSQIYNNTGYGIYFSASNYGTINNSQSSGNTNNGIYFYNGSNYGTVNNSQAYNNTQYGICFYSSNSGQVNNSQSHNNTSYGIYFSSSDYGQVNNSQSYNNTSYGIYFSSSNYGQINTTQSFGNNNHGMFIASSVNVTVNTGTSYNNTGVGIYFNASTGAQINGSQTYNNSNVGMYFYKTNSGQVNNSQAYSGKNIGINFDTNSNYGTINNSQSYSNATYGIYFSTSSNSGTINNSQSYSNTGYGILFTSSDYGQVNNSQSYNNTSYGIYFSSSNYGQINTTQSSGNNSYGICIASSVNVTINTGTSYNNAGVGIYFSSSTGGQINNSQSYKNTTYGIQFASSSNNGQINNSQTYNNASYGMYVLSSTNVVINTGTSYTNTGVGICFNTSTGGQINSSQIYNNYNEGIAITSSPNATINNSQIYNNKLAGNGGYGIYFYSSIYGAVNNCQIYNNNSVGIFMDYSSNSGLINNTNIYNNTSYGVYYNSGSNNVINNSQIYNNSAYGVYASAPSTNNKYYGTISLFGNANAGVGGTIANFITGTDGLVGRSNGTINTTPTMTRDYLTNPRNLSGNYLFPWTGTMTSLRGQNTTFSFTSGMLYSFGSGTLLQQQPVLYSGTTLVASGTYTTNAYIGSALLQITGDLLGINTYNMPTITVTGSGSSPITQYNIYGNVNAIISGAAINTSTGLQLTTGTTTDTIITQLFDPVNYFAMHFQKIVTMDTTPPSVPTLLSPATGNVNNGSMILLRSGATDTGVGIGGYLYQVSTDSGFSSFVISGNVSTTGISLTGFSDGTYYRRIAAYDNAGNVGSRSSGWNVIVDTTAPVITFTGSNPSDNAWINTLSFTGQLNILENNLSQFKRSRSGTDYSLYDSGLVLMMNFDKVSALGESNSIIKDLSQYGNNGTAYNEATWTGNGKRGGAFGFSGTTTRNTIQINDAPSLDGMSGLTISTRVKFNSNGRTEQIMYKRLNSGAPRYSYRLQLESSNKITFSIANSSLATNSISSASTISTGQRYYLSTTYDGTKIQIYINGVANGSPVNFSGRVLSSDYYLMVGGLDGTSIMDGLIDEVRIYNRALSSGEISTLYYSNLNKYDTNKWNFTILQTGIVANTTYRYTGYVSDLVNNVVSTGRNIGRDTLVPTIPTLLSPNSGSRSSTGATSLLRNASIDTGSGISGYLYQVSTDSGFSSFVTSGNISTTGISLIGFSDGTYYRRIAAYDNAGNTGSRSSGWNFIVDTTAPVITFTGSNPVDNAWINTLSFTGQLNIIENNLSQFKRSRSGTDYSIYDSGLLLMYNFDKVAAFGETDGMIKDFSQYGNNASGYGGVSRTGNGRWNGAYSFDGNNGAIQIPWTPTANYTISFRFYRDSFGADGYETLIGGPAGFELESKVGSTNQPVLRRYSGGARTGAYLTGVWNHIALIRTPSGSSLYLNGALLTTGTAGGNPVGNYYLGSWRDATSQNFKGKIDEVRIYNRALSAGEISTLYYSNLNKYDTGRWNFTISQTGVVANNTYSYTGYASDLAGNNISTGRTISIDNIGPTFTFANASGPECSPGLLSISNAIDTGIGLNSTPYSFDGVTWGTTTGVTIPGQQPGTQIQTGRVRDQFENITTHTATYIFTDVAPTANDFTGQANVGNTTQTADWKISSNVTEGACGNGAIIFSGIVAQGAKGTCSVIGSTISYTPNANQVGSDSCTIRVKDNENDTKDITVSRGNIDMIPPTATVSYSPTGATNSNVIATLTGYSESLTNINFTGHTFTGNGNFTFTFSDLAGNTGSTIARVSRINPVFISYSGASLNALYTSNIITLTGYGPGITTNVSISAGTLYKNSIAVSGLSTTGQDGDTFAIGLTSSSSTSTTVTSTMQIGITSGTFSITTLALTYLIDSPIAFDLGSITTPAITQAIEKPFTGTNEYFSVADYVGDDQGYYTTLSMGNLSDSHGDIISNHNIAIKTIGGIATLSGASNANVTSSIGGSYVSFGTGVLTFLRRDAGANSGITGKYGVHPAIQVMIPGLQNRGTYSGTLTFTLYPN